MVAERSGQIGARTSEPNKPVRRCVSCHSAGPADLPSTLVRVRWRRSERWVASPERALRSSPVPPRSGRTRRDGLHARGRVPGLAVGDDARRHPGAHRRAHRGARPPGRQLTVPGCTRMTVQNVAGPAPALRDPMIRRLAVPSGDRRTWVDVPFANLGGYLLAKAAAVLGRRADRDPYDLAFVVQRNTAGPLAVPHVQRAAPPPGREQAFEGAYGPRSPSSSTQTDTPPARPSSSCSTRSCGRCGCRDELATPEPHRPTAEDALRLSRALRTCTSMRCTRRPTLDCSATARSRHAAP